MLLDLTSSMGTTFTDLCLDGGGIADVGLGCRTIPGWPNRRTTLVNCQIQNFKQVGIQFGTPGDVSGFNSDMSIMENVIFAGCPIGIQICNCQSVGHDWRHITNSDCPVCVSVDQGGQIAIRGVNQNGTTVPPRTFVRLGAGGLNVGTLLISQAHLENGCLVDGSQTHPYIPWQVIIESALGTLPPPGDIPILVGNQSTTFTQIGCNFNGRIVEIAA